MFEMSPVWAPVLRESVRSWSGTGPHLTIPVEQGIQEHAAQGPYPDQGDIDRIAGGLGFDDGGSGQFHGAVDVSLGFVRFGDETQMTASEAIRCDRLARAQELSLREDMLP